MSRALSVVACGCLIALFTFLSGLSPCWASELPDTLQTEAEKEAEVRILTALAQPVQWDFEEAALGDIVESLAIDFEVPVVLDNVHLQNAGIDSEIPFTFAVRGITGRSALDLMLTEADLTWIVHNEVLFITTIEYAQDYFITKVYDVHDLVTFVDDYMEEQYDFESLINLVQSTLDSGTWDFCGGLGTIEPFQATGLDALVVSQTREVHEEVFLMLKKLREARNEEEWERGPRSMIDRPSTPQGGGGVPVVGGLF